VDELIRARIHEALDVEQPSGDLRMRFVSSLPVVEGPWHRFPAPSLQWAGGFLAALLVVAIVATLLYSRGALSLPGTVDHGGCATTSSPIPLYGPTPPASHPVTVLPPPTPFRLGAWKVTIEVLEVTESEFYMQALIEGFDQPYGWLDTNTSLLDPSGHSLPWITGGSIRPDGSPCARVWTYWSPVQPTAGTYQIVLKGNRGNHTIPLTIPKR
jgi:hypothetical protein